ncbi:MAG: tRNA (N6-threonylcarbamoyladenosine(37)-N6)-methyltransferase TrmO [Ignavibacteriae bacterium]|nr:tRNA (N6-threonylcarbamoyladenosine(37)-N6)-methyltransferase TrmO [Ignavibacteriota bacterium]
MNLILKPIGIIHTPYKDKFLTPRQPGMDEQQVEGIIELFPHQNFEQALEDLSGFERIWILYWFHKNEDWKPKVLPPRSGKKKRGVFSTRSPHRPNPVGLSLCTLLEINGLTLRVANPDLLDGTPILDIKPYIPYADAFPNSRAGWLDEVSKKIIDYQVKCSSLVKAQADWLESNYNISLLPQASKTLSLDPLPHSFRRTKQRADGTLVLAIKSWRVCYTVNENIVTIERIESGYSLSKLIQSKKEKTPLHDEQAHRAFHKLVSG